MIPFRLDTPANHRDGRWLADQITDLGLAGRRRHLRGLHYTLLGRPKPDGLPYLTDDWFWLQGRAGKAARFLGYVPFDSIVDERNDAPLVRIYKPPARPYGYVEAGIDIDLPDIEEIVPQPRAANFEGAQHRKLVIFGEKSSLADVLGPVAEDYGADLYLGTGEPSDTLLYGMARICAEDGRPMVVACFTDCDPSGWQMPLSIARKLQAFQVTLFPDIEFVVRQPALTPDQVREYGLPSTPLKADEDRAPAWCAATGCQQTEIDALASLQPELLDQIARAALDPYFDKSLDGRVSAAYYRWRDEALAAVDAQLDGAQLAQIRAGAERKLAVMRTEVNELNEQLNRLTEGLELPPASVPAARLPYDAPGTPVVDSRWPFAEQCRWLIAAKAYRLGEAPPP